MKPHVIGRIVLLALFLIPLYLMIAIVYINRNFKAIINQVKPTVFEFGDALVNSALEITNDLTSKYECSKDVKIGDPGQFKQIYIISVKGSGNSWTRELLQSLTGFYTGGDYHEIKEWFDTDQLYEQAPFPGEHFEPDSGRVLGIKTHKLKGVKKGDAAVVVIRNPYDTLRAEYNRVMYQRQTGDGAAAHTASIAPEYFQSDKWRKFVKEMSKIWSNFYKYVIMESRKEDKNFHLLFFDTLEIDKVDEMEKLYEFLQGEAGENFEVENVEDRLKCIGEQNLDTFKREEQEIDFELFLPDEIKMINGFIKDYKKFFKLRKVDFPAEILDSWLRTPTK